MKDCRLAVPAVIGFFFAALAPAQSPFAPPATLQPPVPASPAERVLVAPPPGAAPVDDPYRPRLQPPPCPLEGPLFGLEIDVVRPSLGGYIATGPLNTAVPFNILLGWQFPTGRAIIFEYMYFGANADRTTLFPNDPAPVVTHRHIEGQIFDLDVRFLEGGYALLKTQTETGIRFANLSYYASRPSQNYPSLVSNRFQGAGPHLDYKIAVPVFETGLEFYGRGDIGILFGTNHGFSQVLSPPGVGPPVDWSHTGDGKVVGTGRFQLGLSYWFRVGYSRITVSGGYQFDGYIFPGAGERIASGGGPLGLFPFKYEPGYVSLANKGLFLRAELKY